MDDSCGILPIYNVDDTGIIVYDFCYSDFLVLSSVGSTYSRNRSLSTWVCGTSLRIVPWVTMETEG